MNTYDKKANEFKLIFSIVSLLLMAPSLTISNMSFYRTLFIFLINRVIDLIVKHPKVQYGFFHIWNGMNKWLGIVACSFSFCLIDQKFMDLFENFEYIINIVLYVISTSSVLSEISYQFVYDDATKGITERIRNNYRRR